MRKAIQRCSAAAASFPPSGRLFANRTLRFNRIAHQTSRQPIVAIRAIQHASNLRQQAAAQVAPEQSDDAPITKFHELETRGIIHPSIVQTITRDMGFDSMTEVQQATINEAIKGTDVIAQAKTGTGKTMAFLLPILQNIVNKDPDLVRPHFGRRGPRTTADDIRALIISPTRELAEQIAEEAKRLVKGTGVIVQTAVGGTQKSVGLRAIQRQGCHILVGTPGRLKDILSDPYTRVEAPDLSALVFDEADRLLDQGFWPEIQEIMRLLPTPAEKDRQTMMFSATIPKEVVNLVRSTLKPGFQFVRTVREDEEPTHARVPQRMVTVRGFENAIPALTELCSREIEKAARSEARPFKAIVYFGSTAEVALATSALQHLKPPGEQLQADAFGSRSTRHPWDQTRILEIHARLTQQQRTQAADTFRKCESGILLSSDVTARGMDFPNVTHVIQMGLPSSRDQYIHRIGRTARAGKEGEGWLIVNQMEEEEARYRLKQLPLRRDSSLQTAALDLTVEGQIPAGAANILSMTQAAMRSVQNGDKFKVYQALLGVYAWYPRKQMLVNAMNNLAKFGWGMSTPPTVAPGLAQKLRIDRVEGVNIGHPPADYERSSRGPPSGGRGGFGGRDDRYGDRAGGRGEFGGSRGGFGSDRGGSRGGFGGDRGGDRRGGDRYGGPPRDFGGRSGDRFGGRDNRQSNDPFAM